jgi:drug/metabolite transporter (DMT)-like permease
MDAGAGGAARVRMLAAAILFSTAGAGIKAAAFSSWQVLTLRSALAALTVFLILPASRRRWSWRVILTASAYAMVMILFVSANKLTTAAATIYLQAAAPLYLVVLGPWLLREPVRRQDLALMAMVGTGLAMIFLGTDPAAVTAPDPITGNILATASGVFWALTILGMRWMGSRQSEDDGSPAAMVVAGNIICAAVCLPLAWPFPSASTTDWLTMGWLGVFQLGLAYALLAPATRHVPALETSLLLLLEPALNPIWAWAINGERPGAWSLAGGAVIMLSTTVMAWLDSRRQPDSARAAG